MMRLALGCCVRGVEGGRSGDLRMRRWQRALGVGAANVPARYPVGGG